MKAPARTDRIVKVKAFLTDEEFGYDHWWARQFLSPDDSKFAVLVICDSESARDALAEQLAG